MNPTKQKTISLLLVLLALVGCSQKQESDHSFAPNLIGSELITDRPQTEEWSNSILRLKNPAVFSSATFDGEIGYDAKLLEAVSKEQQEVIQKLKAISSEIRIVYRYRFVMNAITVAYPVRFADQVLAFNGASRAEMPAKFARPALAGKEFVKRFEGPSSVDFIGATRARDELGLTGETIRVGVIDSGIDYTHYMFGGPGTTAAYEGESGKEPSALYPNNRIVGGIDLVGDLYQPGHLKPEFGLPYPDKNPLDRGGHGTHVAGTVAGQGDGVNTYDGVAPQADIYGIRVFGAGATGEDVVVAALEFAADPNGDGNPIDRLDVINLSLGSNYGKPAIFYSEAMKNIANSGTLVAASAGNSGDIPYIVGSPSTTEGAFSVAAGIDNMDHNWKFQASLLQSESGERLVKRLEGSISRPIESYDSLEGELVYIGLGNNEVDERTAALVKGNIALIDRGEIGFLEKLQRAHTLGALGAVVVNNQPGEAILMGGEGMVEIGAIMVSLDVGNFIKEQMKVGVVSIDMKTGETINDPARIDTITSFSSRGPRSHDGLLKPEITAPGEQIISAAIGSGHEGVAMNGTSMSSPHMAGVFALLRERYPTLTAGEMYQLVASTSKVLMDGEVPVALARQGAGRVQVFEAASAKLLVNPALISLGVQPLAGHKTIERVVVLKNMGDEELSYELSTYESEGVKVTPEVKSLVLKAKESRELRVRVQVNALKDDVTGREIEALLFIKNEKESYHVTIFGVARLTGEASVTSLTTQATSRVDRAGSVSELKLKNNSLHSAPVEIFNLLGTDKRKPSLGSEDVIRSRHCDLEAAGYRIVQVEGEQYIQFGLKVYHPVSRWQGCEASIQIDINGDGVADQELGGISSGNLYGLDQALPAGQYSVLLDADKVRGLRLQFELAQWGSNSPTRSAPNFVPALVDVLEQKVYNFSTLTVVSAKINSLAKVEVGDLRVKIAMLHENYSANMADDFLGGLEGEWMTVRTAARDQGFGLIPDGLILAPGEEKTLSLEAGLGTQDMMVVFPGNSMSPMGSTTLDRQLNILQENFSQ